MILAENDKQTCSDEMYQINNSFLEWKISFSNEMYQVEMLRSENEKETF